MLRLIVALALDFKICGGKVVEQQAVIQIEQVALFAYQLNFDL